MFFKIDYYDRSLNGHSPDPADPTVTTRVLTIYAGRGVLTVAWGERDIATAPPTTTTSALPSMMLWAAETTA